MITTRYLLLSLLLVTTLSAQGEEAKLSAEAILAEDGDTLQVNIAGSTLRIQLSGIDAPEDRENPKFKVDRQRTGLDDESLLALGVIATEHLRRLLRGDQMFELRYDPAHPDRYGRIPGELFDGEGVSLNRRMVSDGYAIALPSPGTDAGGYAELQRQAREEKRGLWGLMNKPTLRWSGVDAKP